MQSFIKSFEFFFQDEIAKAAAVATTVIPKTKRERSPELQTSPSALPPKKRKISETPPPPPRPPSPQPPPKSSTRSKSTNNTAAATTTSNKKKLYCICKTPYDNRK